MICRDWICEPIYGSFFDRWLKVVKFKSIIIVLEHERLKPNRRNLSKGDGNEVNSVDTMYFDGQLHYLDKDKPQQPSQRQRTATTDQPNSSSSAPQPPPAIQTPSSSSTPAPSMSKSQTVGGPAGDLHSMALKSAISNIGRLPIHFLFLVLR